MFPTAQEDVENVILVTDDEITKTQEALWSELRAVTEPGGAAAFAALLSRRYQAAPGERVGVLLCGGNTSAVNFGTNPTKFAASRASIND
jgi:threonine dehydratase